MHEVINVASEDRDRSPEGRFIYLAEKRVGKALTAINSVAKLSDRKNYSYTEDQASQIIENLEVALARLKRKFLEKSENETNEFKFR